MNRGIYKIIISILIMMELGFIFLSFKAYSNKTVEEIKKVNNIVEKEQFSMYIEQEDGTYKREKQTNYLPVTGYILNKDKTYCEDTKGNEIVDAVSFDSGKLTMTSSKTMYCTLYFDIEMCSLASDSTVAEGVKGAKYNCKVDPNRDEYPFYFLKTNEDGTSDLIMNANINAQGEAVIPGVTSDTGLVAWYAVEGNNIYGPVTAMTYLYNATKSWTNVEPLNYEYYDTSYVNITNSNKGYESFISTNGIGIITQGNESKTKITIGNEDEPLRTRMPIYYGVWDEFENEKIDEKGDIVYNDWFAYSNLEETVIDGFWTMSSMSYHRMDNTWYDSTDNTRAYAARACAGGSCMATMDAYNVNYGLGVRPIINVKL